MAGSFSLAHRRRGHFRAAARKYVPVAQFKAFSSDVEISGQSVGSVLAGMGVFKPLGLSVLERNGIVDPQPGRWFPQQAWLDAFRALADRIGNATMFVIGQQIPDHVEYPFLFDSTETALRGMDAGYHRNHRLGGEVMFDPATGKMTEGIGHYLFSRLGGNHARMTCTNPYPCAFDRGVIDGVAKRFRPASRVWVKVTHDRSAPCRALGAESCTYLVDW